MLDEIREFESLKSLENEKFEVGIFESFEFESGASLEFESLKRNPAWKFGAAATRVARRSKAKDRWRRVGVHRAARRLEFESLRAWSLKV